MQTDILICQCHDVEHQLVFQYDTEWKVVYISVHLSKLPFFKRFKYAIKYLLGYQSRYGAFGEFMVKQKDADKFEKVYLLLRNNDYEV